MNRFRNDLIKTEIELHLIPDRLIILLNNLSQRQTHAQTIREKSKSKQINTFWPNYIHEKSPLLFGEKYY